MKKGFIPLTLLVMLHISPAEDVQSEPVEFTQISNLYQKERYQLDRKYLNALESIQDKLTKKGDLTGALRVKEERDRISASILKFEAEEAASIGDVLAEVTSGKPKAILDKSSKIFTNRSHRFLKVPKAFEGWEFDQAEGGKSQRNLKLDVAKPGLVYLLCSGADLDSLQKDGWLKVEELKREPVKGGDKPPVIVSKTLEKGTHSVTTTAFLGARLLTSK